MPSAREIKYLKSIGKKIQTARNKQKISRAQLAFEVGTSERHIVRIEEGDVNTGVLNLIKIGAVLGINPKDLLDIQYDFV